MLDSPSVPAPEAETERLVDVRGVTKRFGSLTAIDRLSMQLDPGEVRVLLGRNGAGKTTLLSLLSGLLNPDEGSLVVAGTVVAGVESVSATLSVAAQDIGLYEPLTVSENLDFAAALRGVGSGLRALETQRVMRLLHLDSWADEVVCTLSGGQRRRVHVACAFVGSPALVLLDEPTAGADIDARTGILRAVRESAAAGSAVLYSTHYFGEVDALPEAQVTVLEEGRIVGEGPVAELVERFGAGGIEVDVGPAAALDPTALTNPGKPLPGGCVWYPSPRPEREVDHVMTALGPLRDKVRSVRVVPRGIEAAFLSLTAQRDSHRDSSAR